MSIRKRSVTTHHREVGATNRWNRVAAWFVAACLTLGLLAGCSEGTSREAERGKARDAQRTSVVRDLQATRSMQVLDQGTPPPPTETVEP